MRYLLFNLNNVPEDEADAVRQCLHEADIVFYETEAGRWKLGVSGIWLPSGEQKLLAQQVLHEYQQARFISFEQERARLKTLGWWNAFLEHLYKEPLQVSGAILGIVAVLAISILPFI